MRSPTTTKGSPGRGQAERRGRLSLFGFFAITASMVMTVYEYPGFATAGLHLVCFLLLGGVFFLLPVALCSAEMASVCGGEEGGIFAWVSGAMGPRFGFAAIFFQWFQVTVGFVTMVYFILGLFSQVASFPALQTDPAIRFLGVMLVFWGIALAQLGGIGITAVVAKLGLVLGIALPALALFVLGTLYMACGYPLEIRFSLRAVLPDIAQASTPVAYVSFLLAYMGAEASASHLPEMDDPRHTYPRVMVALVALAMVLNTVGGLTVAAVIPAGQISLSGGVMQTFSYLLTHFSRNLRWAVPAMAVLLMLGGIGQVSAWVAGPSRGLHAAAKQGLLPRPFRRVNRHGVPVNLVLAQGLVVSIWAAVLTFGGGGENLSFRTAISLTVAIYLAGYLLLFFAYLKLAARPNMRRCYHVPLGGPGKYLFGLAGLLTSLFALVVSFVPPAGLGPGEAGGYWRILVAGFVVTLLIPFVLYQAYGKKHYGEKEEG